LNNCVLSGMAYGAEVWGGSTSAAAGFANLRHQGLRLCFGASSTDQASGAMAIIGGITPVFVRQVVARVRLYQKMVTDDSQSCYLQELVRSPVPRAKGDKWTWTVGTRQLIRRLLSKYGDSIRLAPGSTLLNLEALKQVLWRNHGGSGYKYDLVVELHELHGAKPFQPMREWMKLWAKYGGGAKEEKVYFQIYRRQFWGMEKFARWGMADSKFRRLCPCCHHRLRKGETLDHYLWRCPKWASARSTMMRRCRLFLPPLSPHSTAWERHLWLFGTQPRDFASVGLGEASARAHSPFEQLHLKRRAWIRARAPIWGFLIETWSTRQCIIGEYTQVSTRVEAVTVGRVSPPQEPQGSGVSALWISTSDGGAIRHRTLVH